MIRPGQSPETVFGENNNLPFAGVGKWLITGKIMNQKAKDYIRRNTLDLESDNRMDSTGYVQYAISEAKAYAAIVIAEEEMRQKAIEAFKFAVDGYFIIGGTDYSARRLNEFIKKLDS